MRRSDHAKSGSEESSALEIFKKNRFLQVLLLCLGAVAAITAISPYDRFDWFLEDLLVFVFVIILVIMYPLFRFSNLSYFMIMLFFSFHLVGAHYSYTETPVDIVIKAAFGFKRDHYDRLVHFMFGLLISYPLLEILLKAVKIRRFWAEGICVSIIMAAGAFYELIEMWVAKIVSPELGTLFLGTQGDPWDTQSDMAMALYGSLLAMLLTIIIYEVDGISRKDGNYMGLGG